MIIVRIHGGLGNQLFQYAIGRHLSLVSGTPLGLAVGSHNPSAKGAFGLSAFHIAGFRIPPSATRFALEPTRKAVESLEKRGWTHLNRWHRVFVQKRPGFDPQVLDVGRHAYLVGFWQSFKYFQPSARRIAEDLRFRKGPSEADVELVQRMKSGRSVAIHIRRGDYRDPRLAPAYDICDAAYYQRARALMAERHPDAKFYVFSDEIENVAREFADWPRTTFVRARAGDDAAEFILMCQCNDLIVANSSFSWWAAWLGTAPDKIVIAPKIWANDPEWNTDDIIPPDWIRL
jgi:hypothetical protein